MKTEPSNICAYCVNFDCALLQLERQGNTRSIDCFYPEVTFCDDYKRMEEKKK